MTEECVMLNGVFGVKHPFDAAQDKPFDAAQDKPFDAAQDQPFDAAQDRLFGRILL